MLAESAEGLWVAPVACAPRPTAFVDGVRRGEGLLYRQTQDGTLVRGTVGAYGCGAVLCEAETRPVYGPIDTKRLVIFGGGMPVALPAVDGYEWEAAAIASTELDAPLQELQTRMRMAEGLLAERLAMIRACVSHRVPSFVISGSTTSPTEVGQLRDRESCAR